MRIDKYTAVTFDFGQTLASLDSNLTAARLAERGWAVNPHAIEESLSEAWTAYNNAVLQGFGGHPWKILMHALLGRAAPLLSEMDRTAAVDFLWEQQPIKNLWRRPIEGMIELIDELRAGGVPVGVVSNSEGKLAELIEEMGWSKRFDIVADSGKLGMEKPGRAIFDWAAERLGVPVEKIVHVGDSYAADVEGALGAGMAAIWFRGMPKSALPNRCFLANDANDTRQTLSQLGIIDTLNNNL